MTPYSERFMAVCEVGGFHRVVPLASPDGVGRCSGTAKDNQVMQEIPKAI